MKTFTEFLIEKNFNSNHHRDAAKMAEIHKDKLKKKGNEILSHHTDHGR